MDKLKDLASTAKARIGGLESQLSATSNTFRFKAAMIYKMIGQLADFDSKYRGLVDITLDNDALEAAGTISFNGIANEGKWHTSPAYLDALSQLGGFVMNANEGVDLEKEVFINHGWGALQLFERIDPERTYRSYVKMREDKDKLWLGDVAILDDQMKLVGVVQNVSVSALYTKSDLLADNIYSYKGFPNVSCITSLPQPTRKQSDRVPLHKSKHWRQLPPSQRQCLQQSRLLHINHISPQKRQRRRPRLSLPPSLPNLQFCLRPCRWCPKKLASHSNRSRMISSSQTQASILYCLWS
jgi:hypothetical protein